MYNGKEDVCQEESLQWIDLFAKGSRVADGQSIRSNLKLSAASCGESLILVWNKTFRFCSLTLRQAAGNALAADSCIYINVWGHH
jgi:hypothetical protein